MPLSRYSKRLLEILRRQKASAGAREGAAGAAAGCPAPQTPDDSGCDEWLRSLMDNAPNLILFKDTDGFYRRVNRQLGLTLGRPQREILRRRDQDLFPADIAARLVANDREVMRLLAPLTFEEEVPTPVGPRTYLSTKFPVFRADGEISGIGCIAADITEHKAYRLQLRREREKAVVTLSAIGEGVISCDDECDVEYLNPVAEALLEASYADVVGRPLVEVLRLRDEVSGERLYPLCACTGADAGVRRHGVLVRADGTELPVEETATCIRGHDGQAMGMVMVLRDASSSRSLARRLSHEASHDPLTGLLNRRAFDSLLLEAADEARRDGASHVLAHLDLDRFKQVNDLGGHDAGDQLLRELSELLLRQLRAEDVIARLGGDEFGLLLHHCDLAAARRVAEQLRTVTERYRLLRHGQVFQVTLSIGLTPVRADNRSIRTLHDAADRASYLAKEGGRNQVQTCDGPVGAPAARDGAGDWQQRLEQALARGAFRLFCQEIQPLQPDGDILRGEVLLRMKGEGGNLLLPGAFLPMAERYGLMARLDRWVVGEVLSRQSGGRAGELALTVNLSAQALVDQGFADFVADCLRRHPQDAGRICFEFSELSLLTAFTQALRLLPALKALGFALSVERFGTGHASYGYLKALPVDYLKIDGELVREMCNDALNYTLVQSMNQIGHTLNKKTIAEAAEDERILSSLRELGVDYAQGYIVARPQPLEEFGSYR